MSLGVACTFVVTSERLRIRQIHVTSYSAIAVSVEPQSLR